MRHPKITLIAIITSLYLCTALPLLAQCNLVPLDEWGTGDYVSVAIKDQLAFCGARAAGVDIVNISNPTQPIRVADFNTESIVTGLAVHPDENLLFVTVWYDGVEIYDIQNPLEPVKLGSVAVRASRNIFYKDDHVFITNVVDDELTIINVSNPASPFVNQVIAIPSNLEDILLHEESLFVAHQSGISIYDVSNANKVIHLNNFGDNAFCLGINGTRLHAVNYSNYMIYDITNLMSPQLLSSSPVGNFPTSMSLFENGRKALIGFSHEGMQTWAVSESGQASLLAHETGPLPIQEIRVADDMAYIASGYEGLRIYNLNTGLPNLIGRTTDSGYLDRSAKSDHVMATITLNNLVGGNSNLRLFDISNPEQITHEYSTILDGWAYGLAILDHYLYVSTFSNERDYTRIYDISNPANPVIVATSDFYFTQIEIHQDYAFAILDQALVYLDLTNPLDPQPIPTSVQGEYYRMNDLGNILILNGWDDTAIVDARNPQKPNQVGAIENTFYPHSVTMVGTYLYHAYSFHGSLRVYDFGNLNDVRLINELYFNSSSRGVIHDPINNRAYYSNEDNLVVLDTTTPEAPVVLEDFPARAGAGHMYLNNGLLLMGQNDAGKITSFRVKNSLSSMYDQWPLASIMDMIGTQNACDSEQIEPVEFSYESNGQTFDDDTLDRKEYHH